MKQKRFLSLLLVTVMLFSMTGGMQQARAAGTEATISTTSTLVSGGVNQAVVLTIENDTLKETAASVYINSSPSRAMSWITKRDSDTQITVEVSAEMMIGDVFTFRILGEYLNGGVTSNILSLTVPDGGALALPSETLETARKGAVYNHYIRATGGNGYKTVTLEGGTLPPGLNFFSPTCNTAQINGWPSTVGEYSFTLKATDNDGNYVTTDYSLKVNETKPVGDYEFMEGTVYKYIGNETNITVPSTLGGEAVEAIGQQCFLNKQNITSVVIESGITSIGYEAFRDCTKLETVTLPDSITSMEDGVFCYNYKLTKVNIPKNITEIPDRTFDSCNSLKSIVIPASVESIGDYAFKGYNSTDMRNTITSAVFLGDAPTMGTEVFENVAVDFKIYYPIGGLNYSNPWNGYTTVSYDPSAEYTLTYNANANGEDNGAIPGGVTGLYTGDYIEVADKGGLARSKYAFEGWNTAPDGSGDYYNAADPLIICNANTTLYAVWTNMYSITIEDSLHGSISADASEALEKTKINVTVTPDYGWRLKAGSLKYNDGISDHVIADGPSMPFSAEAGILGMPVKGGYSFTMPAADVTITAEFEDASILYNFDEETGTILGYLGSDSNIIIPSEINGVSVKYIGEEAFCSSSLTGVTIPEGVIGIGDGAFCENYDLEGVTLPETLTQIGKYAFEGYNSLRGIKIPSGVDSIGDRAFKWSYSLKSAYFEGNAPENIGIEVFDNTSNDFKILYNSGSTGFDEAPLNAYDAVERQSLDSAAVDADLNELDVTYALYEDEGNVKNNLYLTVVGAVYGSDITWTTVTESVYGSESLVDVISNTGLVTRPNYPIEHANVKLTATVSNNNSSDTKEFALVVLGLNQANSIYKVTFDKNGGSTEASPAAKTVAYGTGIGTLPTAPIRSGYSFEGWNTAANGSGTSFTKETAVIDDITAYAQWAKTPDSDNGNDDNSSGNSGNTGSKSTPPAAPGIGTSTGTTTATATTDNSGKATAAVTQSQLSNAISQALADTAKVEIKVIAPADAKSVETSIPKAAFNAVTDNKIEALTITTPIAAITFDGLALDTISKEAAGDVKITISKVDVTTLSEETKQAVGDRPVFNFSVTSGDKTISQFGGNVEVSVPYTPKAGEDTSAIVIYYINAEGKPEIVSNCSYDPVTGTISFSTNHFSMYAVGYNKVSFKDVASDAAYSKAISFIAAREITTGTGEGNFSPEASITRGQFLVLVMNAYGIKPDETVKDNFEDAGNTYYTDYLAAAKRLGITNGTGNNMYAPDNEMTQQEMISLLFNTLKLLGELPIGTKGKELTAYSDADQIASWAKEPMTLFVKAGIIDGDNDKLSPTKAANRAAMAEALYGLLKK